MRAGIVYNRQMYSQYPCVQHDDYVYIPIIDKCILLIISNQLWLRKRQPAHLSIHAYSTMTEGATNYLSTLYTLRARSPWLWYGTKGRWVA